MPQEITEGDRQSSLVAGRGEAEYQATDFVYGLDKSIFAIRPNSGYQLNLNEPVQENSFLVLS
ncbi:hypothetical protein D3C80_1987040 [compost metagenome]